MDNKPFIIEIVQKKNETMKDVESRIYAFNTAVPFQKSLEEMKGIIKKLGGEGFQYTEHPNSAKYVRFLIHDRFTKQKIPIQIDIPIITIKTLHGRKELERAGIRLAILDLKTKLYKLDGTNLNPTFVLAENILTKSGMPINRFLTEEGSTNIAGLLPESTED